MSGALTAGPFPVTKSLAQRGFHLGGVEIADDSDDDVIGMDIVSDASSPVLRVTAPMVAYSGSRA